MAAAEPDRWNQPSPAPTRPQVDMPEALGEASGALAGRLRVKVESPQFRSSYWYDCVFTFDGRLPTLLPR